MALEREVKLILSVADVRHVLQHFGPPRQVLHQVNHYLDSPTELLRQAQHGVRLRSEVGSAPTSARTCRVTFKGPSFREGDVVTRLEEEAEISHVQATRILQDGLEPDQVDMPELRALCARLGISVLRSLGSVQNDRQLLEVRLPTREPVLLLELDCTHFPDGSTEYELECELGPHAVAAAPGGSDIVDPLRAIFARHHIGWRPHQRDKFVRFLEHRR